MTVRVARLSAALLFAAVGCGGNGSPPSSMPDPTAGTISGTVNGTGWTTLSNAYWAGKMVAGSPPVVLFLFEAPVRCADIVNLNWDKTATGDHQILELAFTEQAARGFTVMTDVFANYLFNNYNPDAFSGTAATSRTGTAIAPIRKASHKRPPLKAASVTL